MKRNGVEVQKGERLETPRTQKTMTYNEKLDEAAEQWRLKREYSYGYPAGYEKNNRHR